MMFPSGIMRENRSVACWRPRWAEPKLHAGDLDRVGLVDCRRSGPYRAKWLTLDCLLATWTVQDRSPACDPDRKTLCCLLATQMFDHGSPKGYLNRTGRLLATRIVRSWVAFWRPKLNQIGRLLATRRCDDPIILFFGRFLFRIFSKLCSESF